MSTRSNICRICKSGTLEKVYCHYDGYFSGVGADLIEFCPTQEKVDLFFHNAAFYNDEGNCVVSVKEVLETTRKPAEGLGELDLHFYEFNVERYLSDVKENRSIEFLYIWVPTEFLKEDWLFKNITDFRNFYERPNNIEENGGAWIACDNQLRVWSWAETLAKGHKAFERKKLGKLRDKFDLEDWCKFVYTYMLEGEEAAKKLYAWTEPKSIFESKPSEEKRDIEDYKNMVEGLHEIADKIKSADYLPKTLEAYDAYISALSYMVNKLKEDKVNLLIG